MRGSACAAPSIIIDGGQPQRWALCRSSDGAALQTVLVLLHEGDGVEQIRK